MSMLRTLLGIEAARGSAAAMRETCERLGYPVEHDETPLTTEHEILGHLALYGTLSQGQLRMIGSAGVVGTAEAVERLAQAGKIEADEDGRWRLVK